MFTNYMKILEEQKELLKTKSFSTGIPFPFLVMRNSGQIIAAKIIPTKRTDKHNVCFACVKPNMKPNGVFLGFDEEELKYKYNLEVVYYDIFVSEIKIEERSDGTSKLSFNPDDSDYSTFFNGVNARLVNDLSALENL